MSFTFKELLDMDMLDVGEWFKIAVDPTKSVMLRTVDTGLFYMQTISIPKKDTQLFRYIGTKKGEIQLISEPIAMQISFFGKTGYKNVERVVNKITREVISSSKIKVRAVQKSDWDVLPSDLKYGSYILATKRKKEIMGVQHNGVYMVQNGSLYVEYLSTSYRREYKVTAHGIRVIATIPVADSNIEVIKNEDVIDDKYMSYDVIVT